ncbi:hypothetical protein EYF80_040692 [Liparis tanakae]|uniref:Uncharacterized protein n=1 Tax=Liparis tanakae TaxID=230148 RepID=A0A4Z2G691_9TELE|nr:hypothetical protein EYF80_040692 [Liparis tanakae]
MEELLLELLAGRPSALPAAARGGAWLAFFSETTLVREDSRLALLSAALVLAEAELFSPPPRGDVLLGGRELCNPGEPLLPCWAESGWSTSGVWDKPFFEGVAVLKEAALLVFGGPSLGDGAAAPLFAPSAGPFLCFGSFAAAAWRGLSGSAAAATASTWSPEGAELLGSAPTGFLEWSGSVGLLPSEAASADLAADALSGLASATSPMRSSVGDEECDSREKREGEWERSCSLAACDQDGLAALSLSTSGLAMAEREGNVWRCRPRTAGRPDRPEEERQAAAGEDSDEEEADEEEEAASPSSSLRSPANSADSDSEASEVRREEPDEAWLGGRLPIRRLIQCSHREEETSSSGIGCTSLSSKQYHCPSMEFLQAASTETKLEALGQGAGLRLQVLLLRLAHALGVGDVLVLGSFEQAGGETESGQGEHQRTSGDITHRLELAKVLHAY